MKYKIGQSVKVKQGVQCSDDPDFDLSEWQGRVIEIFEEDNEEPTVGIKWDSITLNNMPKVFIEKSEREDLNWSVIYLYTYEVESTQPRDSELDANKIRDELEKHFGWLSMGEEGKLIQSVVNSAESFNELDVLKAWKNHLEKNLQFPFKTVVNEYQSKGPLDQGDLLKVFGIELIDDLYGVIVACRRSRKRYDFPLLDLKVIKENSENAKQVQAYRTWFANRC